MSEKTSSPTGVPPLTHYCYLCGSRALAKEMTNWQGHLICPACLKREQGSATVHPKLTGTVPPTAHDLLSEAASTITQRGKDYNKDEGERSMTATVEAFNRITGHNLTTLHGWQFMVLLKMVRIQQSPSKRDSHVDLAAYAALAGEEALK